MLRLVVVLLVLLSISQRAFAALPADLQSTLERLPASSVSAPLQTLYREHGYQPLWLENDRLSARGIAALAVLHDADRDGLRASDYLSPALNIPANANDAQLAATDVAISTAMAHYVHDMVLGRVDPAALDYGYDLSAKRAALPGRIAELLQAADIAQAANSLQPALPQYQQLKDLLARYRQLAKENPEPVSLPALPAKKLESGQTWAGTTALANWLVVLGDMQSGQWPADRTVYDGTLVEGVKHFQARHGLLADGVLGAQTLAALQTPLSKRIEQIELAMERLRWLNTNTAQPYILVNIPQFTLWAYAPGAPTLSMAVVTGDAKKTQTPIFSADMSHVIFSPYWNVPRSIAVKELLPKIDKNAGYLVGEDMELVGRDGSVHNGAVTRDQRNGIVLGDYRIRQRPGEKNALGRLKFMFPNNDDIYMHDTPSKKLFARARRDFSHGCIRLSNPLGMALYALATTGEWDEARINAQIDTGTEKHLALKQRIPVWIVYLTAAVNDEGNAVFLPDVYGRDATLSRALR